jgi:hypothetical protein
VALQQKEMIKMMIAPEWDGCYRTPAGWLTKFLDMNKEVIYDGSNQRKYERFLKPGADQAKPKQESTHCGLPTSTPPSAAVEVTPIPSPPLSAPSKTLDNPSATTSVPEQRSELPRWVLPAAIGGTLLILLVLLRVSGVFKAKMKGGSNEDKKDQVP